MSMAERIQADLHQAMRQRDDITTSTLRMLISDIQREEKKGGATVVDETVVALVKRAIKARKEAAEQFRKGGREELAVKEEAEEKVLDGYLPAMLDEAATRELVRRAIEETGVTDRREMGKVMGRIMGAHRAEVDGALVKRLVEEAMGGGAVLTDGS